LQSGKELSHAYIIAAQPEAGAARARELAMAMLCTAPGGTKPCGLCRSCRKVAAGIHPDVLITERKKDEKGKEKREIYVEQIREIVASAVIMPNEAERKVYIIRDAGTMNAAAQNALLKILEEPPAFVSFILVADNAGQLLETVRSRCVILRENGEENVPAAEALARAEAYLDAAAAGDRIALVRFANENGDMTGAEALEFVRAVRYRLTEMLCAREPAVLSRRHALRMTRLMDKAEEYLKFNVGTKHVLGMLCVETVEK